MPIAPLPKRLHYLDILRGVAAFCVVLYHWQHFFFNGTEPTAYDHASLPFYRILGAFYEEGLQAVQLFFCLSGFIFFWLYSKRIAQRQVGMKEFALLRFSRLYPLHLATLLFVAVAQFAIKAQFGSFFIYPFNDAYHFVLQLFFMSNWGFQHGWSFNGPIWSVSVEVLLYILFALVCMARLTRWAYLVGFIGVGYVLTKLGFTHIEPIGEAIISFFCGGLAYKLFVRAYTHNFLRNRSAFLLAGLALMWIVIPIVVQHNLLFRVLHPGENGLLMIHGKDLSRGLINELTPHLYSLTLFPLTLISLALLEAYTGDRGSKLAFIGEASYSSYLLHFPLQIVFYSVTVYMGWSRSLFYSPLALFLFFAILIPLSVVVYRHFERPMQNLIRARLSPKTRV